MTPDGQLFFTGGHFNIGFVVGITLNEKGKSEHAGGGFVLVIVTGTVILVRCLTWGPVFVEDIGVIF